MAKASAKELLVRTGSTRMGKLPPTMFMTNRKTPIVVDLTDKGTTSTKMANKIPNHISAVKTRVNKQSVINKFKFSCCLLHQNQDQVYSLLVERL